MQAIIDKVAAVLQSAADYVKSRQISTLVAGAAFGAWVDDYLIAIVQFIS